MRTVVVVAASEKAGSALSSALLGERVHLVLLDTIPESHLSRMMARLMIDRQLQQLPMNAQVTIKGDVDLRNIDAMASFFHSINPDIVVNYATAPNWREHEVMSRFEGIRRTGLGAFIALEAVMPMLIGQALHNAGVKPHFVVGNLPDLTIPVLHASSQWKPLVKPLCGAGSIGLIKFALLTELKRHSEFRNGPLHIDLVAHHIHWEAARAPELRQTVPLMLRVNFDGKDVTKSIGDIKTFAHHAIIKSFESSNNYENTTGLLACRVIKALLNEQIITRTHVPAPNGLGIGVPCLVSSQGIELDLPKEWEFDSVQKLMITGQRAEGIEQILPGGGVRFTLQARKTLKETTGFTLPEDILPSDFAEIAEEQVACFSR